MTEPLSPERLELLLPALRHVAEMLAKSGNLDRKALQLLLMGSGLEDEWVATVAHPRREGILCWPASLGGMGLPGPLTCTG